MKKGDGEFICERYFNDPVGYAYDILQVEKLEDWQIETLKDIVENQRVSVTSGHGIGKTFEINLIIHWFISTRPYPQIVVTANTKNQLDSKTWRELGKVNSKALNKDWFTKTATKFFLNDAPDRWFASAIPWSENNSEAFAGTHEDHVLILFDEASAIPDIIWDVCEGAMTTKGARWVAFGNPTKNTGRFRECWGKFSHRWKTRQVDSSTVSITDKDQIKAWIDDYGEDSDFVRVRIKGQFPRAGSNQFINSEDVANCVKLELNIKDYMDMPLVFGVDIARFGEDQNCVCIRRGRKIVDLIKWRGLSTMDSAGKIYELIKDHSPAICFIDGVGVGGGVVDRLNQLVDKSLISEVNVGVKADEDNKYFNKRAEIWGLLRDAIKVGLDLPDDNEMIDDLTSIEYGFDNKNRIQLESKDSLKKRGLKSPDCADAIAMTYSKPILKTNPKPYVYKIPSTAWN